MLINASAFEIFFPIQLSRAHDQENQFKILSLWNMISEWYQATSNSGEIDSGQDKDRARDDGYFRLYTSSFRFGHHLNFLETFYNKSVGT